MANRKRIPPEPRRPAIPGGVTRPSLRVSLAGHRTVARRRALNARLLAGTCAFDTSPAAALTVADVELLRRISAERFSAEQVLLRMQAVRELGRATSLEGVDRLVALATSSVEGEQVRAASVAALKLAAPQIAQAMIAALERDPSRLVRQTASEAESATSRAGRSGSRSRKRRKSKAPALDTTRKRR